MKNTFLKIIILIFSAIAIIGLFLPYTKAQGDYREYLETEPDRVVIKGLDWTKKDIKNMSHFEYFQAYLEIVKNNEEFNSWTKNESLICFIILIVFALSILAIIIFALLNKPILIMIFSLVMGGISAVLNWDIESRGTIGKGHDYTQGLCFYLHIALAVIIFITAIVMLVRKIKAKKIAKKEEKVAEA